MCETWMASHFRVISQDPKPQPCRECEEVAANYVSNFASRRLGTKHDIGGRPTLGFFINIGFA